MVKLAARRVSMPTWGGRVACLATQTRGGASIMHPNGTRPACPHKKPENHRNHGVRTVLKEHMNARILMVTLQTYRCENSELRLLAAVLGD